MLNQAPAPNRRPRFPLGSVVPFEYHPCAPPLVTAAVGEARRSATSHTMTFAEILQIEDAYSAMGELSILLAKKAASQIQLSPAEQAIHDIMWVDVQVNANGFDGWLYYTPSEHIARTVHALSLVGCSRVSEIIAGALVAVRLNPQVARDSARESLLDSLSDEQRERLSALDSEYYDAAESCMAICREFVISRRVEFCVDVA